MLTIQPLKGYPLKVTKLKDSFTSYITLGPFRLSSTWGIKVPILGIAINNVLIFIFL